VTLHSIYTGVGRDGTGENSEKVSVIVTLHSMNTGAPTFSEFLPSHHGPFFHTILREYARAHTRTHTHTHTHLKRQSPSIPTTADPRIHETPNIDSDAEFPDAEFRFSQLMYQGQTSGT